MNIKEIMITIIIGGTKNVIEIMVGETMTVKRIVNLIDMSQLIFNQKAKESTYMDLESYIMESVIVRILNKVEGSDKILK